MNKLRIGLIADIQYAEAAPYKDRYFKNSLTKLKQCIKILSREDLDFVVNLGDSIDHGFHHFEPVMEEFEKLPVPVYHLAGNHDFEVEDSDKEKVLTALHLPACGYHSFNTGNYRCLLLNSNAVSLHAFPARHTLFQAANDKLDELMKEGQVYANFWNGGLGTEQLNWMESEFCLAHKAGEKVLIFCHQPFFPEDRHNLWDTGAVKQLISKYDHVPVWFCGHNHHGNYGQSKHCHCINLKGLVETELEICGAVAEISENYLYIRGFGREPDRQIAF